MKFLLTIILSALSIFVFSQNNFEIIKIDNSAYPLIKLYIQTDTDNASKTDFRINELDKDVNFKLDTLPTSSMNTGKSIFFMIENSKNEDTLRIINSQIISALKKLQANDKVNFGFFSEKDTSLLKVNYLNADFSSDFKYFSDKLMFNNFLDYTYKYSYEDCNNIFPLLLKIKSSNNIYDKKALIYIASNKFSKINNPKCVDDILAYNMPIYTILTSPDSIFNEEEIIKICTRSGGLYTKSSQNKISEILKRYIEDIDLQIADLKANVFVISFKTKQTNDKNKINISYKGNSKISFFRYYSGNKILKLQNIWYAVLFVIFVAVFVLFILNRKKKNELTRKIEKLKNKQKKSDKEKGIVQKANLQIKHKETSRKIIIPEKGVIIGRNAKCDIIIPDATISAFHADIKKEKGYFIIKDLDSTNGTILNGNHVTNSKLSDGDIIKIGNAIITFSE